APAGRDRGPPAGRGFLVGLGIRQRSACAAGAPGLKRRRHVPRPYQVAPEDGPKALQAPSGGAQGQEQPPQARYSGLSPERRRGIPTISLTPRARHRKRAPGVSELRQGTTPRHSSAQGNTASVHDRSSIHAAHSSTLRSKSSSSSALSRHLSAQSDTS